MAALDAAGTRGSTAPVFVDDAGRRARLVRVVGVVAGLLVLGFIAMVGASLFGASWVPKLSLGVAAPAPTRVVTKPFVSGPTAPDAVPAAPTTAASVGAATARVLPSRAPAQGAPPVATTSPATVAVAPLPRSTAAPGRSTTSTATPAARGLTHKKASTGATTTTTIP